MRERIVLTGYMGTGKSSVGKRLAHRLSYRFIDLDEMVIDVAGMSISDIFAQHGEPYFRQLESAALESACAEDGVVIATGGGAVIADKNRLQIRQNALVVNLTAGADEIQRRLADEDVRPLLRNNKSIEAIQDMLNVREQFYADADLRIDTTGKTVEEIVDVIASRLNGLR